MDARLLNGPRPGRLFTISNAAPAPRAQADTKEKKRNKTKLQLHPDRKQDELNTGLEGERERRWPPVPVFIGQLHGERINFEATLDHSTALGRCSLVLYAPESINCQTAGARAPFLASHTARWQAHGLPGLAWPACNRLELRPKTRTTSLAAFALLHCLQVRRLFSESFV